MSAVLDCGFDRLADSIRNIVEFQIQEYFFPHGFNLIEQGRAFSREKLETDFKDIDSFKLFDQRKSFLFCADVQGDNDFFCQILFFCHGLFLVILPVLLMKF